MRKHKKLYCIDCGKLLSKTAYWNKYKRCKVCANLGIKNPMYCKQHSKETKNKMSRANSKKRHPQWKDGRTYKKYYCIDCNRKLSSSAFFYHTKRCSSCAAKYRFKNCNNHPRWLNGISFEPYDIKFNKAYKESIRMRDKHKCQLCGAPQIEFTEKLSVHHIDYNKTNTTPKNNISLCRACNAKVNVNRKYWKQYFKKIIKEKYAKLGVL